MTLDEAVKEIEAIIPCIDGLVGAYTNTLKFYTRFGMDGPVGDFDPLPNAKTAEEAVDRWRHAMSNYLDGKSGTLHWRKRPEIAEFHRRWKIYCRFAVVEN